MMTLGDNLRALRQNCKMTQQQAADRLGVTRQALSGYEANRTRPDIDRLQALAALYGTDLEGVLYGTAPELKARKILRISALTFLLPLTGIRIVGAAALWAANRFFPFLREDGSVIAEMMRRHAPLVSLWERSDAVGSLLAAVGGLLLLIAVLALRCRFSLKQKLIYFGLLAAGLLLPGLCFGLADPVFHVIDYLIMPGRDVMRFAAFFLLLLAAEAVMRRREKKHL